MGKMPSLCGADSSSPPASQNDRNREDEGRRTKDEGRIGIENRWSYISIHPSSLVLRPPTRFSDRHLHTGDSWKYRSLRRES